MDDDAPAMPAVPPPPGPLQTIGIIAILIPLVAGFFVLGGLIGIHALYMGFLFSTYWGAVEMLNPARFLPSMVGGLLGIGIAFLLYVLPLHCGLPGLVAAILITLVPIYFMIRQQLQIACNVPFVVFLTVATIPALTATHDYPGMVYGILYGAAFCKAVQLILQTIMARRAST